MGSCSAELLNEAKNTIFFFFFFSVKALFFEDKTFGVSLEETGKKDFTVAKIFWEPCFGIIDVSLQERQSGRWKSFTKNQAA